MKFHISSILAVLATALAIVPDASIKDSAEKPNPGVESLPNLFTITNAKEIKNYDISGSLKFDASRLVFENGKGALWARNPLKNSRDEWTIDLVFRNSEVVDTDDHSYVDTNGFAFWLLQKSSSPSLSKDTSNFGGPAVFDGLQFLVNNKEKSGLKIFANDGTKQIANQLDSSLGTCSFGYLDSMVPFTLRLSYSASKNWFKVQVDNSLCFKTDALTFKKLAEDFTFGATASVHQNSKEYWEVLKLDTYPQLTEDAIDDHAIISDSGAKVVTVVEDAQKADEESPNFHPSKARESLMERTRKWIEQERENEAQQQGQNAQQPQQGSFDPSGQFSDILSKISGLEALLKEDGKSSRFNELLERVLEAQLEQMKIISELGQKYANIERIVISQNKESVSTVLDDLRVQRNEIADMSRRLNLALEQGKQSNGGNAHASIPQPDFSEFYSKMVKGVLIPIVIGIVILSVIVHRLRRDIKHSKLL